MRYSVRPGPVRKTLNSSCSSLPPYARWQKEYRVANIDVGNAEIKLATSSVHPVSTEHCPRQPGVLSLVYPPQYLVHHPMRYVASGLPPSDVCSTLFADSIDLPRSGGDARFHGSWASNAQSFPTMLSHLRGSRSAVPESVVYFATSTNRTQQSVGVRISHSPTCTSGYLISGLLPLSQIFQAHAGLYVRHDFFSANEVLDWLNLTFLPHPSSF